MTVDDAPLGLLLAAMDLVQARHGEIDFDLALNMGWLDEAVVDLSTLLEVADA